LRCLNEDGGVASVAIEEDALSEFSAFLSVLTRGAGRIVARNGRSCDARSTQGVRSSLDELHVWSPPEPGRELPTGKARDGLYRHACLEGQQFRRVTNLILDKQSRDQAGYLRIHVCVARTTSPRALEGHKLNSTGGAPHFVGGRPQLSRAGPARRRYIMEPRKGFVPLSSFSPP